MYSIALIYFPILFRHNSNEHRQSGSKFFLILNRDSLTYLGTQVGTIVCQNCKHHLRDSTDRQTLVNTITIVRVHLYSTVLC